MGISKGWDDVDRVDRQGRWVSCTVDHKYFPHTGITMCLNTWHCRSEMGFLMVEADLVLQKLWKQNRQLNNNMICGICN